MITAIDQLTRAVTELQAKSTSESLDRQSPYNPGNEIQSRRFGPSVSNSRCGSRAGSFKVSRTGSFRPISAKSQRTRSKSESPTGQDDHMRDRTAKRVASGGEYGNNDPVTASLFKVERKGLPPALLAEMPEEQDAQEPEALGVPDLAKGENDTPGELALQILNTQNEMLPGSLDEAELITAETGRQQENHNSVPHIVPDGNEDETDGKLPESRQEEDIQCGMGLKAAKKDRAAGNTERRAEGRRAQKGVRWNRGRLLGDWMDGGGGMSAQAGRWLPAIRAAAGCGSAPGGHVEGGGAAGGAAARRSEGRGVGGRGWRDAAEEQARADGVSPMRLEFCGVPDAQGPTFRGQQLVSAVNSGCSDKQQLERLAAGSAVDGGLFGPVSRAEGSKAAADSSRGRLTGATSSHRSAQDPLTSLVDAAIRSRESVVVVTSNSPHLQSQSPDECSGTEACREGLCEITGQGHGSWQDVRRRGDIRQQASKGLGDERRHQHAPSGLRRPGLGERQSEKPNPKAASGHIALGPSPDRGQADFVAVDVSASSSSLRVSAAPAGEGYGVRYPPPALQLSTRHHKLVLP